MVVLEEGAAQPTRMAAGREDVTFPSLPGRRAAALLPARAAERAESRRAEAAAALPGLMTDLRISTGPLFVTLTGERMMVMRAAVSRRAIISTGGNEATSAR